MIKPKFYATAEAGRIAWTDREAVSRYMAKFAPGTELELTICKKYRRRTSGKPDEETNFNGYLWAVPIRMIADEIGEENDEIVHQWIQLAVGNVKVMKDGTKVPAGTRDMSGAEFADYCARIRIWAANFLKMNIPEPNEVEEGQQSAS